ncbi:hypothetical protein IFR04_013423 [Cadophora malorum]|uniref:Uncharacterized protein n=1 Tax=Cadophora malorum TaxID=108018 RepID=A0A8H7T5Q3_9HELO|nr:hypothetical protein IFR04_013423 [Cadophora malorum]
MPNQLNIQEDEDEDIGIPMMFEPGPELSELLERAVIALESISAGVNDQQNSFRKVIETALESLEKWCEYEAENYRLQSAHLEFYKKVGSLLGYVLWIDLKNQAVHVNTKRPSTQKNDAQHKASVREPIPL